jgi:hypothetical protein
VPNFGLTRFKKSGVLHNPLLIPCAGRSPPSPPATGAPAGPRVPSHYTPPPPAFKVAAGHLSPHATAPPLPTKVAAGYRRPSPFRDGRCRLQTPPSAHLSPHTTAPPPPIKGCRRLQRGRWTLEGAGLEDARERERGGAFAGKCAHVAWRLRLTIGSCVWVAHLVVGDAIHAKEEGAVVDTRTTTSSFACRIEWPDMDLDHTLSPKKIRDFVL